jgi:hypothetical protein
MLAEEDCTSKQSARPGYGHWLPRAGAYRMSGTLNFAALKRHASQTEHGKERTATSEKDLDGSLS